MKRFTAKKLFLCLSLTFCFAQVFSTSLSYACPNENEKWLFSATWTGGTSGAKAGKKSFELPEIAKGSKEKKEFAEIKDLRCELSTTINPTQELAVAKCNLKDSDYTLFLTNLYRVGVPTVEQRHLRIINDKTKTLYNLSLACKSLAQ